MLIIAVKLYVDLLRNANNLYQLKEELKEEIHCLRQGVEKRNDKHNGGWVEARGLRWGVVVQYYTYTFDFQASKVYTYTILKRFQMVQVYTYTILASSYTYTILILYLCYIYYCMNTIARRLNESEQLMDYKVPFRKNGEDG